MLSAQESYMASEGLIYWQGGGILNKYYMTHACHLAFYCKYFVKFDKFYIIAFKLLLIY